jgi:hypothetical protein
VIAVAWLLLLAACAVTPLTNKIEAGQEAFLLVVGEGPDGQTDLFAASAGGGPFVRLTFSRPAERLPKVSPLGTEAAFIRSRGRSDASADLVLLDLLTAGERWVALPAAIGPVAALGWSREADRIYLQAGSFYAASARSGPLVLEPVADSLKAAADSATRELLGEPPFGAVAACPAGVCVVSAAGDTTLLGPEARAAFRWGGDSVAVLGAGTIEIRPLGGGRTRRPVWTGAPEHLRSASYHPGTPRSAAPAR